MVTSASSGWVWRGVLLSEEIRPRPALGVVHRFFKGNFVDIPFNRDDALISSMITNFMYSYGRSCGSSLPTNRVMIYEDVCKTERVTKNGWGVETNRYCIEWTEVPTGLYARPETYAAHNTIKGINSRDQLKNVGKLLIQMTQGNGLRSMYSLAEKAKVLKNSNQTQWGIYYFSLGYYENAIEFSAEIVKQEISEKD